MYLAATTEMKAIAQKAFGYTGKKYQLETSATYRLEAYWSGGTKYDCVLVCREGLEFSSLSSIATNPMNREAHQSIAIPPKHFIVEHIRFCGKDMGIRFVIRPDEADTFAIAPPSEELSRNEKIVLLATLSLKSSHGGVSNYRFVEANADTGISQAEYDAAKQSLVERGYLNQKGAATVKGKNERGRLPSNLFNLKLALV